MKVYIVTDVDGEYDPVVFGSEKRATYWILNAGEPDTDYEITETDVDGALDPDELEAADAAADEVVEESSEELEDA